MLYNMFSLCGQRPTCWVVPGLDAEVLLGYQVAPKGILHLLFVCMYLQGKSTKAYSLQEETMYDCILISNNLKISILQHILLQIKSELQDTLFFSILLSLMITCSWLYTVCFLLWTLLEHTFIEVPQCITSKFLCMLFSQKKINF